MSWNLEGMTVSGTYLDMFPIRGKVESSRVKYGGGVVHLVVLDRPMIVFGAARSRVLMDHATVTKVAS